MQACLMAVTEDIPQQASVEYENPIIAPAKLGLQEQILLVTLLLPYTTNPSGQATICRGGECISMETLGLG